MKSQNSAYNEALQSVADDYQFEVDTKRLEEFLEELFEFYLKDEARDEENLADIYFYLRKVIKFRKDLDEIDEYKVVWLPGAIVPHFFVLKLMSLWFIIISY